MNWIEYVAVPLTFVLTLVELLILYKLYEHMRLLDKQEAKFDEHILKLDEHIKKLDEHVEKLDIHLERLDKHIHACKIEYNEA